jgi:hypothetical protein
LEIRLLIHKCDHFGPSPFSLPLALAKANETADCLCSSALPQPLTSGMQPRRRGFLGS